MAGDWIKMRCELAEDPAVIAIAAKVDLDEFAVVGRLHWLWSWMDRQSRNGHARGVTHSWIDRKLQCAGFAQAMTDAGWLVATADGIELPNFERHNGKSAKERALSSNRKRVSRESVPPLVTEMSRNVSRIDRDNSGTREEKRREDQEHPANAGPALELIGDSKPATAGKKSAKAKTPMPDDFGISPRVAAWAEEKGYLGLDQHLESFRRKCEANGYRYADWDAAFMEAVREDWAKLRSGRAGIVSVLPRANATSDGPSSGLPEFKATGRFRK